MAEDRKPFEDYEPEKGARMPDEQAIKEEVLGAVNKTKNVFEVLSLYIGQIGSFIGSLMKTFLGEETSSPTNGITDDEHKKNP